MDHKILLNVLNKTYGIKGRAIDWVQDCKTRILVNETISQDKKLPFSVPQGSCAGPILYNLYASTLEDTMQTYDVHLIGYANDHTIYSSFSVKSKKDEQNCLKNVKNLSRRNEILVEQ